MADYENRSLNYQVPTRSCPISHPLNQTKPICYCHGCHVNGSKDHQTLSLWTGEIRKTLETLGQATTSSQGEGSSRRRASCFRLGQRTVRGTKTQCQTQIKRLLGLRGYPSSWQRIRRGGRSRRVEEKRNGRRKRLTRAVYQRRHAARLSCGGSGSNLETLRLFPTFLIPLNVSFSECSSRDYISFLLSRNIIGTSIIFYHLCDTNFVSFRKANICIIF